MLTTKEMHDLLETDDSEAQALIKELRDLSSLNL